MQGLNYPCASKVPVQHRRQAFSSVMTTLARLHGYRWIYTRTNQKTEYLDSAKFFQHQVRVVCRILIMNVFGNHDALSKACKTSDIKAEFLLYLKTQLRKSDKSQNDSYR